MRNPTALETMKSELRRVQLAQQECLSETGYVRPCYRYKYQILVERGVMLREGIEYLESVLSTCK